MAATQQVVTQTNIPEYIQPYVERMLGKAEALSKQGYQYYDKDRIAGFTPLQQQAYQNIANMQTSPQLGQATNLAQQSGLGALNAGQQYAQQATNPYAVQAYMSPYIQAALQPQMQEAIRQSGMMGQQNAAQAVQAGAFGGSRFGIQEAERQRNLGQNLANIYGTGMQNAFQAANQAQQFGANLGLQGMGQAAQNAAILGQIGQTQFGQQKDILQAQVSAGAQQQALQQQKLSQDYQDFLNQQNFGRQQLGWLSDMYRGLPLTQQTQSTYQAPPSALAQLGGLGLTAYGLFGGSNPVIKTGTGQAAGGVVGYKNGGLVGLLMHDIEKG